MIFQAHKLYVIMQLCKFYTDGVSLALDIEMNLVLSKTGRAERET